MRVFEVIGMKAKYKKIIAITSITIMILLIAGFFMLLEYFKYSLLATRMTKIYTNESNSRCAVVFSYGALQGYTLYVGVVDESKSGPNLTILGPVYYNDIPLKLESVVISSDGSVVAAKSNFYFGQKDTSYWLAYDFKNSICYGEDWSNISRDPKLIKTRGRAISELLQSRGGIAKEFSKDDLSLDYEDKLSYFEWKRWEKQVDKARINCQPWKPSDANMLSN